MRLDDIKDNLAQYQRSGNWNKGIQYLLDIYSSNSYMFTDVLIVSELYWLMIDKDFLRTSSPDVFSSISWSFEKQFIDIFDTSRARQEMDFYYQWIIGILININPEPFFMKYTSRELRIIATETAIRGRQLAKASGIQYLFNFTDSIICGCKTNSYDRTRLINDLNSVDFRENMSDQNLKDHLISLINRNCCISR